MNEQYLKKLIGHSQSIASDLLLDDLSKLILLITSEATGLKICSFWVIDNRNAPKKIYLKAVQSIQPEYIQFRSFKINEGVVGFVAKSHRPLVIRDVIKDERFKEKRMARKLGITSMYSVPLKIENNKIIGVLNCFSQQPHSFDNMVIDQIIKIADQSTEIIINVESMVKAKVFQQEYENQKIVLQAREILAQKKDLSAEEAYNCLYQKSVESCKSIQEVAEAILLFEEVVHN